jgi:prepilin-type processing-associated H-X9-DG protein
MGLAVQLYLGDHGDRYPSSDWTPDGQIAKWTWERALEQYLPLSWTNTAYHCPGYKGLISNSLYGRTNVFSGSYAYNAWGVKASGDFSYSLDFLGLAGVGGPEPKVHTRASQIRSPADMLAIGESRIAFIQAVRAWVGNDVMYIGVALHANDTALFQSASRHGKKYNQLCCDGHVEAVDPITLFDPAQSAAHWNLDNQPHPELWLR